MKKEIFLQPNNLIKSKYNFTTIENKLFYRILFKAQKINDNSKGYNSVLSLDEIKDIVKFKNDTTIENIENLLAVYQQSILQFDYIDELGEMNTFTGGLTGPAIYNYPNNEFRINLHEVLYKHITDFIQLQRDGYTPLNLDVLFRFKGAYTQRFYTLMRLWSREKKEIEVTFKLDDIRNYLKLSDDVYPQYKHFKHNIIKRALKEINEKGNMQVDIKQEIRNGRKVDEIIFSVVDYEPRKYFNRDDNLLIENKIDKDNDKLENKKNVVDFYVPNKKLFTTKTLNKFILDFKDYDFKDKELKKILQESILVALDKDNEEKIKDKVYNYFKTTLENKINDMNKNNTKGSYTKKVKTRFHNINQNFEKYEEDELINVLEESQTDKFGNHIESLYKTIIDTNSFDELSDISKKMVLDYAIETKMFIPGSWK